MSGHPPKQEVAIGALRDTMSGGQAGLRSPCTPSLDTILSNRWPTRLFTVVGVLCFDDDAAVARVLTFAILHA
jgi:hypothetical protein